jgi:hypothetical protein
MPLQIRRGPNAQRLSYTPLEGELVYDVDLRKLFIGARDPVTEELEQGGVPVTGVDEQEITDFLADFNGTIGSGPSLLVDGGNGQIVLDGTVKGNIVPDESEAYDIGSPELRFRELWLTGPNLNIGSAVLSANETVLNLPEGSTVGGFTIASENYLVNEINGSTFFLNIAGNDSTLLVDAFTGTLRTYGLEITDSTILSNINNVSFGSDTIPTGVSIYQNLNEAFLNLYGTSADSDTSWITFNVSRGDNDTPTPVESEDFLSGLLFFGYDGVDYSRSVSVAASVDTGVIVDESYVPGKLSVIVQSSRPGDTAGDNLTMSFDSKGILSAPVLKPQAFLTDSERDLTITSPEPGMIVYVADDGAGSPAFYGYHGAPTNSWIKLVSV